MIIKNPKQEKAKKEQVSAKNAEKSTSQKSTSQKGTSQKGASQDTSLDIIQIVTGVISVVAFILIVTLAAKACYNFGYAIFSHESMELAPGRDIQITIAPGETAAEVGRDLEDAGLIENAFIFRIQKFFYSADMNAGTYTLNTSMSAKEMLEIIDKGPEEEEESE